MSNTPTHRNAADRWERLIGGGVEYITAVMVIDNAWDQFLFVDTRLSQALAWFKKEEGKLPRNMRRTRQPNTAQVKTPYLRYTMPLWDEEQGQGYTELPLVALSSKTRSRTRTRV